MANIVANNYKDRKILKQHKNFMPDRLSIRRPNTPDVLNFTPDNIQCLTFILSPVYISEGKINKMKLLTQSKAKKIFQ